MNNVNTLNTINIKQKTSSSFSKFPYVLALCTILNIANPTEMKADSITNDNLPCIEVVSDSDIIANIERRTGTKLPDLYNQKLKTFITTNKIMNDEGSAKFTADFVVKQMQSDRGISKQSQLLFIRTHIYNEITGTYLYDGSDGDENRLDEYGNVIDYAEKCGKDFRNGYIAYIEQRSADADKRSADADKRSADADKRSADADKRSADADKRSADADKRSADADKRSADADKRSADADKRSADADKRSADADKRSADADKEIIKTTHKRLNQLIEFYNLYKKDSNSIKQEDLIRMKNNAKNVIKRCREYEIDYKAKLSKDVLKFYGIE